MRAKTVVGLLAGVFIANLLYANDTTQIKQFNKVYIGVTFTPGVSYRLLTKGLAKNAFFASQEWIDEANRYENPTFGYSVGIKTGFRLKKILAIETGAEYSSLAFTYNRNNLTFYSGYRPDLTYDPTKYGSIKSTQGFHYLKIPLAFNISLGKGKVKAIINTGLNFDFLIGRWNRTQWHLDNESGSSSESSSLPGPYNRINVSPFVGVGIDYHINQLLTLRIMPTAQLQMFNNIKSDIAERHWLAGINTCLLFGFKKVSLK